MRTVLARNLTAVVTVLALLLLSGCFKLDMDLTVTSDDTVNGTMVMALDKEVAEEFSEGESTDMDFDPDDFTKDGGEAKVEPYEEGDWTGEKITFTGVPLASFNQGMNEDDTSGDEFELRREGNNLVFEATFDATEEGMMDDGSEPSEPGDDSFTTDEEFDDMMSGMAEMMMGTAEMRFSITFPGKVLDTNGKVEGTTVTWTPKFGEKSEMYAKANAAGGAGGSDGGSDTGNAVAIGLGVAGAVLLLGALAWLLLRRRGATPIPVTAPVGAAGAQTQPAGGVQPGWYPTGDGVTYRYHDGTGWTEHTRTAPPEA